MLYMVAFKSSNEAARADAAAYLESIAKIPLDGVRWRLVHEERQERG